ncbi:type II secretion system protein [Acidobacteriota bacterium]
MDGGKSEMILLRKKRAGFSLVEVLLSIVILGILVVCLLPAVIYGFNILSRMQQVALATQIGKEQVEVIRNMTYNDIEALGNATTSFSHDDLDRPTLHNSTGSFIVEEIAGTLGNIKKLTVTITWDYRERTLRKDITTYITRDGINKN